MLLIGVKEENIWLVSRWNLTYPAGWKNICKAVNSCYDYYSNLEILVDNKIIDIKNKEEVLNLKEASSMIIRGISSIIGGQIMITFYNQTKVVEVNVARTSDEFIGVDYEKFNKSLCQYMDSIEIAMH